MWQFFLSSWRAGFRSRILLGVFALGILLVGLAYLSASFSPRQPLTVALDVGLSGLRFTLGLFAITLVQELVAREIDQRAVVLTISYPVPRVAYLVGRYLGVVGLSVVAAMILALLLWICVMASGLHYEQQFGVNLGLPYWFAVFGVLLDVAVVAAFCLWIAALSTVAMLPLVLGLLFAISARAFGSVYGFVAGGADGQVDLVGRFAPVLDIIRWFLPDLSRLDWRTWPMYGLVPDQQTIVLSVLAAVLYALSMVALAAYSFSKREFS